MEPIVTVSRAARIPLAIFLFGSLFGVLGTLAAVNLTRRDRVVVRDVPTHCPTRVTAAITPPVMLFGTPNVAWGWGYHDHQRPRVYVTP